MDYHQGSLTLAQEIGAKDVELEALTGIGLDTYHLGDPEKSLKILRDALDRIGTSEKGEIGLALLAGLSEVWLSQGEIEQAETLCERYLKGAEEGRSKRDLAREGKIKGEILLAKARSSGHSTKLMAGSGRDTTGVRGQGSGGSVKEDKTIEKNFAPFASLRDTQVGMLKEAETELKKALSIAEEIQAFPLLWQIYASLGKVYQERGLETEASEQFTKAKQFVEKISSRIGDVKLKNTFLKAKSIQYLLKTSAVS